MKMKNPYQYIEPANGLQTFYMSESKLPVTTFTSPMKRNITSSLPKLIFGIFFGFLLSYTFNFHMLNKAKQNLCSNANILIKNDFIETKKFTIKPSMPKLKSSYKDLIFVGVMTANKYLNTRAHSVYETWGKKVPGSIKFFSAENSSISSDTGTGIPLVKLKGVDDKYPPQKKSFLMIKHMYDHHINDFEFFMRADDDVYIRTERLETFLKSINSSRLLYIGQAGRGNSGELGRLALREEENFCMGGPGMIFSRATLLKMAPHVKQCLKNLRSLHEDVEIGRCVQKYAKIPCTWSYEMQKIFYHNNSAEKAFTGPLKQKEVHRAITLHPIKENMHMHRVDAYIKSLMLKEKETELVHYLKIYKNLIRRFPLTQIYFDQIENGTFIDHIDESRGRKKFSHGWDLVSRSCYQFKDSNPNHRLTSFNRDAHNDVIRDFMETIHGQSKELGRVINFQELFYGYYRNSPTKAAEYIVDLLLIYKKYRGKKMTVTVRKHTYLEVPYGQLHVKEVTGGIYDNDIKPHSWFEYFPQFWKTSDLEPGKTSTDSAKTPKRIHFIVPLAGRLQTFKRFLDDFRSVCLENSENVELIVVAFKPDFGTEDNRAAVEKLIFSLHKHYYYASMKIVKSEEKFSRAAALELGSSECSPEDLLFFVDVDMTFDSNVLDRIRWLTVRGKQIYYPIVYSEFNPNLLESHPVNHSIIDEKTGYWRSYGFGIVSLYLSDLRSVGGFNVSIVGWGKEDIDLFDKILRNEGIEIMRSSDPGLTHVYHSIECNPRLESGQFAMCEGTKRNTIGSTRTLVKKILNNPSILEDGN